MEEEFINHESTKVTSSQPPEESFFPALQLDNFRDNDSQSGFHLVNVTSPAKKTAKKRKKDDDGTKKRRRQSKTIKFDCNDSNCGCQNNFANEKELINHFLEQKIYACGGCDEVFVNEAGLKNHCTSGYGVRYLFLSIIFEQLDILF